MLNLHLGEHKATLIPHVSSVGCPKRHGTEAAANQVVPWVEKSLERIVHPWVCLLIARLLLQQPVNALHVSNAQLDLRMDLQVWDEEGAVASNRAAYPWVREQHTRICSGCALWHQQRNRQSSFMRLYPALGTKPKGQVSMVGRGSAEANVSQGRALACARAAFPN